MIGIIVGMSNRVVTKTNEKSFVFCSYEVHILLRGDRHPFLLFIMKEILAKNILFLQSKEHTCEHKTSVVMKKYEAV